MRSINTSLIAVLPVLGLMVVGVGLLGVGTLADLALVQIVGILAGAVSSVLLATPILVDLKQRDPRIREQARRVAARRARARPRRPGEARWRAAPDEPDLADDDVLAGELRRERAMAAAAGVPSRTATRPAGGPGARGPPEDRPADREAAPVTDGLGRRRCRRRRRATRTATRSPGCPPWSATSPTSPSPASSSATSPRCWPTARPSPRSPSRSAALAGEADVVVGVGGARVPARRRRGADGRDGHRADPQGRQAAPRGGLAQLHAGVRHRDPRAAGRHGRAPGPACPRRRRRAGHGRDGRGGLRPRGARSGPRSSGSR